MSGKETSLKEKFISFVKNDSSVSNHTSLKEKIETDLKQETSENSEFKENVQIEISEKETDIKEENIVNKLLDDQNHI